MIAACRVGAWTSVSHATALSAVKHRHLNSATRLPLLHDRVQSFGQFDSADGRVSNPIAVLLYHRIEMKWTQTCVWNRRSPAVRVDRPCSRLGLSRRNAFQR